MNALLAPTSAGRRARFTSRWTALNQWWTAPDDDLDPDELMGRIEFEEEARERTA
jgi:hypothetical protein